MLYPTDKKVFCDFIKPYYDSSTSLLEDIDILSKEKFHLEQSLDIRIANFVMKYIASYMNPLNFEKSKSLDSIVDNIYFATYCCGNPDWYQLSMLCDMTKTSGLIKNILNINTKNIPLNDNDGVVFDLGTGTGVLLLGSYILMKRNGINAQYVGIEENSVASRNANFLLSQISSDLEVIEGDILGNKPEDDFKLGNYTDIYKDCLPIMVISELIPTDSNFFNEEAYLDAIRFFQNGFPSKRPLYFPEGVICESFGYGIKHIVLPTDLDEDNVRYVNLKPKKLILPQGDIKLSNVGSEFKYIFEPPEIYCGKVHVTNSVKRW